MLPTWIRWERVAGCGLLLGVWLSSDAAGSPIHLGLRLTLALLAAWGLGRTLLPARWSDGLRLVLGGTVWAACLSLVLTALYYASVPLSRTVTLLAETGLALLALFLPLFLPDPPVPEPVENRPGAPVLDILLVLGTAAVFGVLAWTLARHATTVSLQTPWALLPNGAFALLVFPFAAAWLAAWKARSGFARAFTAAAAWLGTMIVTPLLYPLGYGFDGFIHRASEAVLLGTGTLTPKPFYYLGQYVWTTWAARTLDLPLRTLDIWLVPLASLVAIAAALPWREPEAREARWRLPFLLLLLPLGAFAATTPQSFSYLLALAALLAALWPHTSPRSWAVPLALALWATAAHPLGGLPALALVAGLWLAGRRDSRRWKTAWSALGTLGALLVIPAAFWAQGRLGGAPVSWSWDAFGTLNLRDALAGWLLPPRQTLSLWVDATEWVRIGIQALAVGLGIWQAVRPAKPSFRWYALTGLGLLAVRWSLEHVATFGFLIEYERHNYTDRLAVLSALFLAPGAAEWLARRFDGLDRRSGALFSLLLIAFASAWAVRVYDALPRHDAAQASAGWNVGRGDLAAIHWIHEQAGGAPYAVLANQSVSAAALETYGFMRYARGEVFYYPIPTGGPLYRLFLRVASTDGSASDIDQALALTDSEAVFVVIDRYWWNADLVNERLAAAADQSLSFDDGAVWVYRFDKKKDGP